SDMDSPSAAGTPDEGYGCPCPPSPPGCVLAPGPAGAPPPGGVWHPGNIAPRTCFAGSRRHRPREHQKRNAPFFGSVLEPILERIGDFRQAPPGDPFPLPIGVEKAKPALGWLERLSPSIQPHAIQAAVPELKAILVMLDEGVHSPLLCGERPGAYRRERLRGQRSLCGLMGYQGRSPWLVSAEFSGGPNGVAPSASTHRVWRCG